MLRIARRVASLVAVVAVPLAGCSSGGEATGQIGQAVDTICGGSPKASLDGFPAYPYCGNFDVWTNNGVDTRTTSGGAGWVKTEGGYGYQCVEWAVRYFYFKWNVPRNWFVGYAKEMCSTYPSGVSKTSHPVHGDLAVFTPGCAGADATAGHVAAIDTVGASTISVVQQNPAGISAWPQSCVMCYLHAAANGAAADPCASAPANGDYCGQSPQWGGGQKDVLYDCQNGVTASKTACPYGCHEAPPGQADTCNPPPPQDAGAHDSGDAGKLTDAGPSAAHDAGETAPPHDSGATAPPDAAAEDAAASSASGCGVARGGGAPWGALLGAIALRAVIRRRRRARS